MKNSGKLMAAAVAAGTVIAGAAMLPAAAAQIKQQQNTAASAPAAAKTVSHSGQAQLNDIAKSARQFELNKDNSYFASLNFGTVSTAAEPDIASLVPSNIDTDSNVSLSLVAAETSDDKVSDSVFGQSAVHSIIAVWQGKDSKNNTLTVRAAFQAVSGKETTLADGTKLSKDESDGVWKTSFETVLDSDDSVLNCANIKDSRLVMSDGQHDAAWTAAKTSADGNTVTRVAIVSFTDAYGHSAKITINASRSVAQRYSADIAGNSLVMERKADGSYSGSLEIPGLDQSEYPQSVEAFGDDGSSASLSGSLKPKTVIDGGFGEGSWKSESVYSGVTASKAGKKITGVLASSGITAPGVTLNDANKTVLTKLAANRYISTVSVDLSSENKPLDKADAGYAAGQVLFSDGQNAAVSWDSEPKTIKIGAAGFVVLTGRAVRTDNAGNTATVTVVATRAYDNHVSLSLAGTDSQGRTTPVDFGGFDTDRTEYSVTLPANRTADAFALSADAGPDAQVGKVRASLGENASRILKIDLNGKEYSVTVNFETSDLLPDSPAKLEGIYVNLSGEKKQGQLIANWNVNRAEYTINIAENDPAPYVLPAAAPGCSLKAGDSRYTSDGVSQSWTVTAPSGATRDYTVNVVRAHSWISAPEAFDPGEPMIFVLGKDTENPDDAALASSGYAFSSEDDYEPQDSNSYLIPQGASFALSVYNNQTVSVSKTRLRGMTWKYAVTVLAGNGQTVATKEKTVTYITDVTHKAVLDSINVNGSAVQAFSADLQSYTVSADPEHWTVAPVFDKTTGMSVSSSKNGDTAVLTVISADGLVTSDYTVKAQAASYSGSNASAAQDGMNLDSPRLPETGSHGSILPVIGFAAASSAMAAVFQLAKRRLKKNSENK